MSFHNEVIDRVRRLPGVQGAGFSSNLPYTSRGNTTGHRQRGGRSFRPCTPDYLEVLGARLHEGRWLSPADGFGSRPVVAINGTFAKAEWPGGAPWDSKCSLSSAW